MRVKLTVAGCAALVAGLCAGVASAGEVKGPPDSSLTPRTQQQVDAIRTAAPSNSNSICSYSGLNDMIVGQGPTDFIVQSVGQDVRTVLTPPGVPGSTDPTTGAPTCAGGSNPENP
jgi:hypothetical protein